MIKLSKDKIIRYRCGNGRHDEITEEVNDLIPFLNDEVEIDGIFTLRNLFNIIVKNRDLYEKMFASHLGHFPLHLYLEDMNKKSSVKKGMDIDTLELKWRYELCHAGERDKTIGNYFDIFISFHGIEKDKDDIVPFSIEFHSLNELKDIPINIDNITLVYDKTYSQDVPIFVGKKYFTVYDLLGAVFYEISFNGSPELRDKRWNEIKKDLDGMPDFLDGDKE